MRLPAAIWSLDPRKFYVENVRAVLGTSTLFAEWTLVLAVRAGLLERWVEVLDPFTKRAVARARRESDLPISVICYRPDGLDEEEVDVLTSKMQKMTYYRLADEASRRLEVAQYGAA